MRSSGRRCPTSSACCSREGSATGPAGTAIRPAGRATSLIGLSSRKAYISLYVLCSEDGAYLTERYVDRLPKANIGKSCVRFKRTSDIDLDVLRELLAEAGRLGPPHPA